MAHTLYGIRQGTEELLCFDNPCQTEKVRLYKETHAYTYFFHLEYTSATLSYSHIAGATSSVSSAAFHFKHTLSFGKCIVTLQKMGSYHRQAISSFLLSCHHI